MTIKTDFLTRCILTMESEFVQLQQHETDSAPGEAGVAYDIFRAACVKEFELVLEQSGGLLSKRLRPYFASNRQADQLTFKDRFRHAAKHGLIPVESCERWLMCRDIRNDTAHRYGAGFAEATLKLLPTFIVDAKELAQVIAERSDD